LVFVAGGFFMLSETALPMWQNWQNMQNWQPTDAHQLSFTTAENDTRVHYRYDIGGVSYRGNQLGVTEFKDNIGSWHQYMQASLGRIKRSGDTLRIWVNPFNPVQAVVDRYMRWGLFTLASGFCAIFILIGLAVIYASIRSSNKTPARRGPSLWDLRKRWQQAQAEGSSDLGFLEYCQQQFAESQAESQALGPDNTPPIDWQSRKGWEDARIQSAAAKGALFFWGFAIVWNAICIPVTFVLPRELQQENYAALLVLLFPVAPVALSLRQPSVDHRPGARDRLPRHLHVSDQESRLFEKDSPHWHGHVDSAIWSCSEPEYTLSHAVPGWGVCRPPRWINSISLGQFTDHPGADSASADYRPASWALS
jgi:hypothetical protein